MTILANLSVPRQGEIQYPYGPPPAGVDVLWRCEAKSYSYVIDPETERYGSTSPVLEMRWHRVKRWTPCGATLEGGGFVLLDKRITSRERWSRMPAEALVSFQERRKRQIGILKAQLQRAEFELSLAEGASA